MHRILTATLLTLAATLAFSAEAFACSCAGPVPGEEAEFYRDAVKRADGAVFLKVVRRELITPEGASPIDGRVVLTVKVKRAYKKLRRFPEGRTFKLHTSNSDGTCGLPVRRGDRMGLLIDRHKLRWHGGLCGLISKHWLRKSSRAG